MNNYKLLILFFLINFSLSAQSDPVILEVAGEKVTKSEFLQIYLKNNNSPKYDKTSLDEYMVLFKKFKLKVAEAEALGYDTIPRLRKELDGYKKQLSTPYLTDSEMNEYLVKEAYGRMENEIRASHILLRLDLDASPMDSAKVYARIMALRKRIISGEEFETVAKAKWAQKILLPLKTQATWVILQHFKWLVLLKTLHTTLRLVKFLCPFARNLDIIW